jgi:hypothetical protein
MFFLSMFSSTKESSVSLDDMQKGPPAPTIDDIALLIDQIGVDRLPPSGVAEIRATLDVIQQELQTAPRYEIGTMAELQAGITGLVNGDLLQYDSVQAVWKNAPAATVVAGTATAPVTKTVDFSVASGEKWIINNKAGSSCVVTLPTASDNVGRELHFQNYQAQTLVSASSNVIPLAGGAAGTAILGAVAGANATLVSDGTNWVLTQ